MRTMVWMFSILVAIVGGCASSKTLSPVAQQNVENIRVLTANTETLSAMASKAMDAVTRIAVIQRERAVMSSLFPLYVNQEDRKIRDARFKSEVEALRASLDQRRQTLSKEKFASYLNQLLMEKPGVADVAAGYMSLSEALEELDIMASLGEKEPGSVASKSHAYLADLQAVGRTIRAREDILTSLDGFARELSKQGDLAEKHALAFLDFSKVQVEPAGVIGGLVANQDFAEAVAKIVLSRTNDPERAEAARDLIKSVLKEADTGKG